MIDSDQLKSDADKQVIMMAEFTKMQVLQAYAREGFPEETLKKAEMLNNPLIKATALNYVANTVLLHRNGVKVRHRVYTNMIKEPLHEN